MDRSPSVAIRVVGVLPESFEVGVADFGGKGDYEQSEDENGSFHLMEIIEIIVIDLGLS